MDIDSTCYMCSEPATTREHVPPVCLFPEIKDTRGIDFRINLLTVPSCEDHNLKKTKDDEFLLVALAGYVGNNYIGYFHSQTKVNRALRRKSKDFLTKQVMINARDYEILGKNGKKYPVIYGNIDSKRFTRCFAQIARGLFYAEFLKVFEGECTIILGFIKYLDEDTNTLTKFLKHRFELENLEEEKGSNPHVFRYQFCKPDKDGLIALRMIFYQGAEVYVAFIPKNAKEPFDLGLFLLKQGIHTTIKLGDKSYEFNKKGSD